MLQGLCEQRPSVRILVVGAGAIGSYYGACLWRAGHDVVLVARGAHRDAIAAQGLTVVDDQGEIHAPARLLAAHGSSAEPVELALVCTKLPDVEAALQQVARYISPTTIGLSLQNGIEADTLISPHFAHGRVLLGTTHIFASIASPGRIQRLTRHAAIIFGQRSGLQLGRAKTVQNALDVPRIDARLSETIIDDLWTKLAFVAPNAGACAYLRASVGEFRSTEHGLSLFRSLLAETAAVGRACGARLSPTIEADTLRSLQNLPPDVKASMLVDLERGKPLELEWLTGAVVRLGREVEIGVPTSTHVLQALRPYANGITDSSQ